MNSHVQVAGMEVHYYSSRQWWHIVSNVECNSIDDGEQKYYIATSSDIENCQENRAD
jgi:hypothetical protein